VLLLISILTNQIEEPVTQLHGGECWGIVTLSSLYGYQLVLCSYIKCYYDLNNKQWCLLHWDTWLYIV